MPSVLIGGGETIGIRTADTPFIFRVFDEIDFPLVQTSANASGGRPALKIKDVLDCFGDSSLGPDLAVDGGECVGVPSTVIDLSGGRLVVLREGAVSVGELEGLFRETGLG